MDARTGAGGVRSDVLVLLSAAPLEFPHQVHFRFDRLEPSVQRSHVGGMMGRQLPGNKGKFKAFPASPQWVVNESYQWARAALSPRLQDQTLKKGKKKPKPEPKCAAAAAERETTRETQRASLVSDVSSGLAYVPPPLLPR